ncbi:DUF5060 domain-containing protein, partial [bacterium]|nr:DUF5060 domain-containing protein [bacterium]
FTRRDGWSHFGRRSRYVLARWGGHPAVAGWELWCTMPANGADGWHARAGELLATYRLGPKDIRSHHPQTVPPASFTMLNTFRRDEVLSRDQWAQQRTGLKEVVARDVSKHPTTQWKPSDDIKHRLEDIAVDTAHTTDGGEALKLMASYPGEAAIVRKVEADWHTYDRLALDVFVPKDAPNDMRVMVYLRDGDLWWYETLLPTYLRPGDWTKLLVDLTGATTSWTPHGHSKVFDRYTLQRVRVMGLRVFGHRTYAGALYVDNIQLWRHPARKKRIKVITQRPNRVNVPCYEKFELTFRLSETFANPFDPDVVKIDGHFTSPSGKKLTVPAFFHQDYERHLADGRELLAPKGLHAWKLRFTPTEAGTYTYSVSVNGRVLPAIRGQQFDCLASNHTGFVRRSTKDPRYFELTSGQFFYPIGINLRSPSDNRKPYDPLGYELPEGKGTYIYDEYYKKLAAAGVNWVRIWQCPWWCGLEWTRKWPGYQGIGRYNLESAWRFDYLLDQAAARGIYVQVCLTNHGQVVIAKNIDRQWDDNPLNAELGEGGPLHDAAHFYTDPEARKLFTKRLRYTVARWGYHPKLMAFALFSEMEFTKAYWNDAGAAGQLQGQTRSPPVSRWVGEMAAHLKSIDPFGHLVTTHFSHPWRGADVWERPELDFVQSNAYSGFAVWHQVKGNTLFRPITRGIDHYYRDLMSRYGRPVLIAEYGGHWMKNSARLLDAELHAGLWSSITSHLAGSTGYWWWLHVHYTDKYSHYAAATRFMAGEDRRGLDLQPATFSAETPQGGILRCRALKSNTHATVWVYEPRVATQLDGIPPVDGAHVNLADMTPGAYAVEFWDTYTGKVTQRARVDTRGNTLRIELPTVQNDLALKVKPVR